MGSKRKTPEELVAQLEEQLRTMREKAEAKAAALRTQAEDDLRQINGRMQDEIGRFERDIAAAQERHDARMRAMKEKRAQIEDFLGGEGDGA